MIIIKLKEAKLAYERRTGRRWTWAKLAPLIGIPKDTLSAMATRPGYNTTLEKINRICEALDLDVSAVLERRPDPDAKKPKAPKKRPKGKRRKKPRAT